MNTPAPRFPIQAFLWLSLAAVVLRVGTNLSRVDENFAEGIYRGTLAASWHAGAPLWPRHWAEIPHVPGSILVGALAVPFYGIFGPTTFALHCSGILFHVAGLAAWMLLLTRRLDRRTAILGGALYVLAPPGLAKMAVLSYGDHVESLPFFLFAAVAHLDWLSTRGPAKWRTPFLAGVSLTLAVSFHLQATLGIAALGVVCVVAAVPRVMERSFWKELLTAFLPGAVAGAAPGAWLYYYTGTSALTLWGGSPADQMEKGGGLEKFLDKWVSLVRDGVSYSFQWEDRRVADATLLLAMACAAGLAVAAARRLARKTLTFREWWLGTGYFVVYPLVFSVAYGASSKSFRIEAGTANALEVRYVLPVIPFLLLPAGAAAVRLWAAGRQVLAALVCAPVLVMGLTGSLATWDFDIIRHEPARRGYLWEEFDGHWAFGSMEERDMVAVNTRFRGRARQRKLDGEIEAFVASEASPRAFIGLIAKYDATAPWTWPLRFVPPRLPIGPPPDGTEVAIEWIREPPSGFEPFRCVAAAEAAGRASRYSPLVAAKLLLSRQDPFERKALARGLGRGLMSVTGNNPPTLRFFDGVKAYARVKSLPQEVNRADIAFGFGFRLGTVVNEFFPAGDTVLRRFLETFPAEMHPGFAKGLGAGYRLRFLTPPGPGTRSPGADRLLTMMSNQALTGPFIEGFYGGQ